MESPFGDERDKVRESFTSIGYEKRLVENSNLVNQRQERIARPALKELQAEEWNLTTQDTLIRAAIQSAQIPMSVELIFL